MELELDKIRQGNFFQDKLTNEILVASQSDDYTIIFTVLNREKYPLPAGWQAEPILLSEDWFINLGFKKSNGIFKKSGIEIGYSGYDFVHDEYSFRVSILELSGKIKYVHHLQNLYFDLKNEELQFKLES